MVAVAVVGIGCRLPGGVHDGPSFWNFMLDKGDGIVDIPADRWNADRFYDPDPDAPGRSYTRRGGFMTQSLWDFDPEFFGMSPREASVTDPQQRLLLEVAWEALDDAGHAGRVSGQPIGVFVGGFTNDSAGLRSSSSVRAHTNSHSATSSSHTLLSNRISFALDLVGPSMTIDTACSSSLVAVHQAVLALEHGECTMALVGGVNAMFRPETFVSMCKGRFLSFDGRSKSFDAAADGYGRGEGAGMVVLRPLSDAIADGDRIYSVIRGSGVNQDGRTIALPVPNPVSQHALATRVCGEAGIEPHRIEYVEAHGTGTAVGDPLELDALGKAYGAVEGREKPLVVGSIKASIGHTEAAAGIASVIKCALTLYHRTIVPQGWLDTPNPAIPFDRLQIRIPLDTEPLTDVDPHVAVNGFGYGGTNAHVIMSAAPIDATPAAENASGDELRLLPLSGRTDAAVRASAEALTHTVRTLLEHDREHDLPTLVAAAWSRRAHHPVRACLPYTDAADLLAGLTAFAAGDGTTTHTVAGSTAPVFVFSGMGPQWWAMARSLLLADGEFARVAGIVDAAFVEIAGWSIIEELQRDEDASRVTDTAIAQPANFLVQVALVAELAAVGIEPTTVVGHSVGEVSAAYISGALSLHDALLVSFHRARLQATTAGSGGMLAVGLSEADAVARIDEHGVGTAISVAAVNSPTAVTLAGDTATLTAFAETLTGGGIFATMLRVEVPYHSHLMDPILAEIDSSLRSLDPQRPTLALYSTVTASRVTGTEWNAAYWCENVRRPVRFADTVTALIAEGHRVFLEIGPHPVLSGNIREILIRAGETGTSIGTLTRGADDRTSLTTAVQALYGSGAYTGMPTLAAHVELPAYPWQRVRCWSEPESSVLDRFGDTDTYPMLGDRTNDTGTHWSVELSVGTLPWLLDHVVDGLVLLPGTAYLDAALSAAAAHTGHQDVAAEDVEFVAPLVVDAHDVPVLQISVEESTRRFVLRSRGATENQWTVNATGRLVEGRFVAPFVSADIADSATEITGDELYPLLAAAGLQYGPAFRGIVSARIDTDTVVAEIDASRHCGSGHLVHPAVLDTALQCVAALAGRSALAASASGSERSGAVVPAAAASVRRYGPIPDHAVVVVRRTGTDPMRADITVTDDEGRAAVALGGVEFRPVAPPQSLNSELDTVFYEPVWELRETRDTPLSSADTDRDFALVVVLGDTAPGGRAQSRAQAVADARRTSVLLQQNTFDDGDLTRILRTGLDADGIDRATVVAVAGEFADPAAAVHALTSIARTLHNVIYGDAHGPASDAGSVDAVIVTERAFCMPGDVDGAHLTHSGLVGARRSLRNEQAPVAWRLIDAEADTANEQVVTETFAFGPYADDDADEVVLRQGSRWALTLRRTLREHLALQDIPAPLLDPEANFAIEKPASKMLSDLAFRALPRSEPAPGQIEVRVHAIDVNYKDPLKVMGVLGERELAGTYFGTTLGLGGLGVVTRVGPGVDGIEPGDHIGLCTRDIMARFVTLDVNEGGSSKVPREWEYGWCSSILPLMCARFGLLDLARVRPGETVLIHGAAGGLGLAAIQVALGLGATVIATAGTEERRAVATDAGAHHVLPSRSLDFVDGVLALTGGRGVDVVYNSSPGEIMAQNLHVAAEFGRIVELGKADIYFGGVMDLAPFDRNLTFFAVDMDRMFEHKPDLARSVTEAVIAGMTDGTYSPLPYTVYPLSRVGDAFDAVVRSTHTGRVVLSFDDDEPTIRPATPTVPIDPDAAYVVTGGFGAFGMAIARWLVAEGARHLVLVGRSGPTTESAVAGVAAFRAAGVRVVDERADISQYDAVAELLARTTSDARLGGVFHTAGVVDNLPVAQITEQSIRDIFAPKVTGAQNLDRALAEAGLTPPIFVMFSSMSSLSGGTPQVSYSAANSVLDALAWSRRARGQSALTVSWGAMSGGGMAEAADEVVRYLDMLGFRNIDMDIAARYLHRCLALDIAHVAVVGIDWERWGISNPASAHNPRFAAHIAAAGTGGSGVSALHAEILALPEDQRADVLTFILAEQLAEVMGIEPDAVDTSTPLPELGLDSLMAVEFAARVGKSVGMEMSVLEFGRGQGLAAIGAKLAANLTLTAASSSAAAAPVPSHHGTTALEAVAP